MAESLNFGLENNGPFKLPASVKACIRKPSKVTATGQQAIAQGARPAPCCNQDSVKKASKSSEQPRACGKCNAIGAAQTCSRCLQEFYCSSDCQVADWKSHRRFCRPHKMEQFDIDLLLLEDGLCFETSVPASPEGWTLAGLCMKWVDQMNDAKRRGAKLEEDAHHGHHFIQKAASIGRECKDWRLEATALIDAITTTQEERASKRPEASFLASLPAKHREYAEKSGVVCVYHAGVHAAHLLLGRALEHNNGYAAAAAMTKIGCMQAELNFMNAGPFPLYRRRTPTTMTYTMTIHASSTSSQTRTPAWSLKGLTLSLIGSLRSRMMLGRLAMMASDLEQACKYFEMAANLSRVDRLARLSIRAAASLHSSRLTYAAEIQQQQPSVIIHSQMLSIRRPAEYAWLAQAVYSSGPRTWQAEPDWWVSGLLEGDTKRAATPAQASHRGRMTQFLDHQQRSRSIFSS
ncbi:hypothetical protein WJX84_001073 [Apatococcus fuscideae]|uniref:MYND-type domain-containing protein n=1 Tax=Apatococcus fuscideae TaxID=2026836 RepID=A0AAW1TC42_9CHLO